jgi:hypothetical protein
MNRSRRLIRLVQWIVVSSAVSPWAQAATAVPQWQQIFHPAADGTTSSAPIAARELADGTVLVVTQTFQSIHYNHDGSIASFRQLNLTPPGRHPSRSGLVDRPESGPSGLVNSHAVIDGFGIVVIAVVEQPDYYLQDAGNIETVKFDGLTGEALWPAPAIYHPASGGAYPTGVFVDPLGDVIVTGLFTNPRHVTLKYDGKTGALLWGPVLRTDLSPPVWTSASAVDPLGNVYVSVSGIFPAGFSTVKYSGATGAVLWGPVVSSDGPDGYPEASTLDAEGNLLVTGVTSGRFATFQYNGNSGALMWGPSHFTPPVGATNAIAQSAVLDTSSNLFVSGRYDLPGSMAQYATQKISGATGFPLWTGAPVSTVRGYQPAQAGVAANGDLIVGGALGPSVDLRLNFWRYRGSDGMMVWGPSEFGPIGPFDAATFFVGSNDGSSHRSSHRPGTQPS